MLLPPLIAADGGRRRLLASLASCSCCLAAALAARPGPAAAAAEGGAAANGRGWGYASGGAARWPGACASGSQQSPVPLSSKAAATSGSSSSCGSPPAFSYAPDNAATVKHTGTTLQVNFAANRGGGAGSGGATPTNRVAWSGRQLELLQYHFHTPSEHALDGRRTAMEAHLVHRDTATGGLAVLAALLECPPPGAGGPQPPPNPALAAALAAVPALPGPGAEVAAGGAVDPLALIPHSSSVSNAAPFVSYRGSLTTPPCSEGVDWLVWLEPLQVPRQQVDAFAAFASMNARPLQPLNGRALAYSCLQGEV